MNRNVINKHRNSPFGLTSEFFKQGLSEDMAKGVLVITTRPGYEGLYVLNNDGEVKLVGQSSSAILPQEVIDKINQIVEDAFNDGIMETIDNKIDTKIDAYNPIVVESGNTIVTNLQEYTDEKTAVLAEAIEELKESMSHLGSSDHVFISQTAYNALFAGEKIKIDSNGNRLYPGDVGYDDAKFIKYSKDVYYCIPEGEVPPTPVPESGGTATISGSTMIFNFEVVDNTALILENGFTIDGTSVYYIEN